MPKGRATQQAYKYWLDEDDNTLQCVFVGLVASSKVSKPQDAVRIIHQRPVWIAASDANEFQRALTVAQTTDSMDERQHEDWTYFITTTWVKGNDQWTVWVVETAQWAVGAAKQNGSKRMPNIKSFPNAHVAKQWADEILATAGNSSK